MSYDGYTEIRQRVIDNLKSRYMQVEDNLVSMDGLFLAIGVVNHVIDQYRDGVMSEQEMIPYFKAIEKHLDKEIEIFWDQGQLKFRRLSNDDYTAKMQKLIDNWKRKAETENNEQE